MNSEELISLLKEKLKTHITDEALVERKLRQALEYIVSNYREKYNHEVKLWHFVPNDTPGAINVITEFFNLYTGLAPKYGDTTLIGIKILKDSKIND